MELQNAAKQLMSSEPGALARCERYPARSPVRVRVGDALLEGVIDALLDRTAILDYKTGSTGKAGAALRSAVCLYAEALRRLQGVAPDRAWLYYVDTGELIAADVSQERVAAVLEHAASTIETLRKEPVPDEMETYLR